MTRIVDRQTTELAEIAQVTCRRLAALMKAGWTPPFAVLATDAEDEHIFGMEYDGDTHVATTDDPARVLPNVKYPVAITISDATGNLCCVEIAEDLTVLQ